MRNLTVWVVAATALMILLFVGRAARGADPATALKLAVAVHATKADPFTPTNAAKEGRKCYSCINGGPCRCSTGCECYDDFSGTPREGARQHADDGGEDWRWTNAEGGYWWRPAKQQIPVFRNSGISAQPAYYHAPAIPSFGGSCSTCR